MRNPYKLEALSAYEYYLKGLFLLPNNSEEGIKYLITAGENSYPMAYRTLGIHYYSKGENKTAVDYMFKAQEKGFEDIKDLLNIYVHTYISGHKGHKKQMLEILDNVKDPSQISDYELLAHIGIAKYMFDQKESAAEYLKKAVRRPQGHEAYYHLSLCYRDGIGIEKDIEFALTCLYLAEKYPSIEIIDEEKLHYKRKGFFKRRWKYKTVGKEKYLKKQHKKVSK